MAFDETYWMNAFNSTTFQDAVIGGALGTALAAFVLVTILILIGIYVYFAFAWYTIAKRRGHKNPWLAWIPISNIAMCLEI